MRAVCIFSAMKSEGMYPAGFMNGGYWDLRTLWVLYTKPCTQSAYLNGSSVLLLPLLLRNLEVHTEVV